MHAGGALTVKEFAQSYVFLSGLINRGLTVLAIDGDDFNQTQKTVFRQSDTLTLGIGQSDWAVLFTV